MSKILNREEFGLNVDRYKRGDEVNEGLFQFLKSLFKQDWANIKSQNPSIKRELEKIDKSLDGFTIVKRSNFDVCNQYRQALCDFANNLLDGKMEELDKGKSLKKVVIGIASDEDKVKNAIDKKIKQSPELSAVLGKETIKSKTLREKLQNSAKEVSDIISKNAPIAAWANALKKGITNIINDAIIAKADSDDKEMFQKALDNKKKEDEKWLKDQNKLGFKTQDEKIKKLEKERQDVLSKTMGVTPLAGMDGTKALAQLQTEFKNLTKNLLTESIVIRSYYMINEAHKNFETFAKELQKDTTFGFNKIMEQITNLDIEKWANGKYENTSGDDEKFEKKIRKKLINIYFGELNTIYEELNKQYDGSKAFDDVPCDAVQSLYIGLALAVGYGLLGDDCKDFFLEKHNLDFMTRCCIEKDATIGYSFPLVDENKPDEGTIFVALMKILADAKDVDNIFNKKTDAKLLTSFKQNMAKLFKQILDNAKKIKENEDKQKEKEAEALKKKEQEEAKKEE